MAAQLNFEELGGPLGGAVFDGQHRLKLWRRWDRGKPIGLWVMLNPSLGDGEKLDPTLRKCKGFAQRWGWGGFFVGNLFTLVSPYPKALTMRSGQEINAPGADEALLEMAASSSVLVYGWGCLPDRRLQDRVDEVTLMLAMRTPHGAQCLGSNQDGSPRHPLYVKYEAELDSWFPDR